ncbi:hypothetical protein PHMEG_0009736 [Phytophthora megakarya]|uniref:Uncharacterized protein n=1 Tax=Phytophthora megakarya TaxID=4795 RepID=A0A225WFG2_9STRA|nr:hypothetical protein PHMEG_0009736 [Phytophthora megakarya]
MDAPMLLGISIKWLVILLGSPAFFVTPLVGDRFTAVKGVYLVLDRMTYQESRMIFKNDITDMYRL